MFGKKTADDLLKMFQMLSEDEKAKFLDGVKQGEETNEQVADSEEIIETETVPEDSQDDNSETEEQDVTELEESSEEQQQVDEAQLARIESLESEIAALKEKIDKIMENFEKSDFGLSPKVPENEEDGERFSAVMRGYAGNNASKYY